MDPIHPIVPHPPDILPVTSLPAAARVRDQAQQRQREAADRERRRTPERDDPRRDVEDDNGDDGHPHVDLTA
jgi:hypothetical protein